MDDKDDDMLIVRLDRATADWLAQVAAETGGKPAAIAASILHDIRVDDERADATLH